MKEYAAGIRSSELRLVDGPGEKSTKPAEEGTDSPSSAVAEKGTLAPRSDSAPEVGRAASPGTAAGASLAAESRPQSSPTAAASPPVGDKFLTAATKEFEAGIVDQPLWKHAMAQASGDRTVAARSYLRARATALRVVKREKRQERSARRARAMNELAPSGEAPPGQAPAQPASASRARITAKSSQAMLIGGALAVLFVGALLLAVRTESGAAPHGEAAKTPARADASPSRAQNAVASSPEAPARAPGPGDDLAAKLEALKAEGNWNVVVLYAAEWTRKQPNSLQAWKELASDYAKLGQYRDALDAANKVTQLAPEDPSAWRSVGEINVALRQPVEALAAYEQAAARDENDAPSIIHAGVLDTQLGRFPEARLAFAKALALNPSDVDALCGAAALARKEERPKDAESLLKQVAGLGGRCRDVDAESVRVAVGEKGRSASRTPR